MSTTEHIPIDAGFDQPLIALPAGRMTEEEFVAWCPDDVRAEWVDGEVIMMSPANEDHSDLVLWLAMMLRYWVQEHELGKVYAESFTIRLGAQRQRRLPDVMFISNERMSRIGRTFVDGAPDMAIEVISPDSEHRDRNDKFVAYAAAGMREYWIIDPDKRQAEVYVLSGQQFVLSPEQDSWLVSSVVSGFRLRTAWLWSEGRPKLSLAIAEMAERPRD